MDTTEVEVKQDEHGECYLEFPQDVIDRLGWKDGDPIIWEDTPDGLRLSRPVTESVEIELSEFDYKTICDQAQRAGITFDAQCSKMLQDHMKSEQSSCQEDQ